jgi:hypothetical protein
MGLSVRFRMHFDVEIQGEEPGQGAPEGLMRGLEVVRDGVEASYRWRVGGNDVGRSGCALVHFIRRSKLGEWWYKRDRVA